MISAMVFHSDSNGASITLNDETVDHPLIKSFGGVLGALIAFVAVIFALVVTGVALPGAGIIVLGAFLFSGAHSSHFRISVPASHINTSLHYT